MRPIFFITASIMVTVAVLLLLWPLLRNTVSRMGSLRAAAAKLRTLHEAHSPATSSADGLRAAIDEVLRASSELERTGSRSALYAGIAVIILVPLAATALYRGWSFPARQSPDDFPIAANGGTAPPIDHGVDMQAAIAKLADQLREHPDDIEGWTLLGRTYKAMQQYAQARDAFAHAVASAPGDLDLAREYANAETPDPEVSTTDEAALSADESHAAPRITVEVMLNPQLKDQVAPNDTVFVYAKAVQGPAMPLALMRLKASQLPASVTLTDAMGMIPNLVLSQFPKIVLGARISKSGNATAQSGDLQTLSAALATTRTEPVQLTIDRQVD